MGRKYLDTKKDSLEQSVLGVWKTAVGEQSLRKENKKSTQIEAKGDKEAYTKFFNAALKKFGVSSPAELKGDKEKKFYDYVDKNWKADHEEEVEVDESYEMGTDEYRKHTQEVTPGQEISKYQNFKVDSMKEALAKIWGLDEWISKNGSRKKVSEGDKRRKENKIKSGKPSITEMGGKTATGEKKDEIDMNPKIGEKKY